MQAPIRRLREIVHSLSAKSRTEPSAEAIYHYLFTRDLRSIGIEDVFYPVGSAANASLLYLILRCLRELEIKSVLELGCGQSTLLIDKVKARLGLDCAVRTVEHDAFWAKAVARNVHHDIVSTALEPIEVAGHAIGYYRLDAILDGGRTFDCIIVDGPPAYTKALRYARLGCLKVIESCLAPDFVLILDDAERDGEAAAVAACRDLLRRRGIPFQESQVVAAKRQHLFCGGSFTRAAFF
jgi:predicted O-methyltransferase YrrM